MHLYFTNCIILSTSSEPRGETELIVEDTTNAENAGALDPNANLVIIPDPPVHLIDIGIAILHRQNALEPRHANSLF